MDPAFEDLRGPAGDTAAISDLLASNFDRTPNFDCRVLVDVMEDGSPITRAALRQAIRDLLADFDGPTLFYFSGHGLVTDTDAYIATCDSAENDWGVAMSEIANLARNSPASDIVVLLDCCTSGAFGNPVEQGATRPSIELRENTTVLAASTSSGSALEAGGVGVFTAALCDALNGGAADHMGWVSAPSAYAYVERRFGAWDQRPTFKMSASRVLTIRRCAPLIERTGLDRMVDLFPSSDHKYVLGPEYEPEDEHGVMHEPVNHEKVAIAGFLKDLRDTGLVRAVEPGEQFYWVARRGHAVELTDRGREYWWLVTTGKL